MSGRSIIMLRTGSTEENYQYYFFGSAASLFDKFSAEQLGISQGSLNNYFSKHKNENSSNIIYQNPKCLIIKSTLYTKSDNRGRKEFRLF